MLERIDLGGAWQVYQTGGAGTMLGRTIPATVPGCIHTDLLAAGLIEDPYYRANELDVLWIGESDWCYERNFHLPPELLERDRVLLRAEGLDTLAIVTLNDIELGTTDNMFRTWEFDVKTHLRAGENQLRIAFSSPVNYVRSRGAQRSLPAWGVGDHKLDGGGWIRKEPCNFGWDWGPMLATSGIWRAIGLVAFDHARLADIHLRQHHAVGRVTLTAEVTAEGASDDAFGVSVAVRYKGERVADGLAHVDGGAAELTLEIPNPQLWWPNTMGEQPLYDVEITLQSGDGERTLDTVEKRIGLRTLSLVREPDQWGQSFHFAVNGVPFFAKGANWIPADTFASRIGSEHYARLIDDAAAANMNMLRVWGGGIYEDDTFYALCDERGICIWQDFMFACATYPTFDAEWMETVTAEARDNIRRIRHHASLALWCGNNELEQGLVDDTWTDRAMSWEDYDRLYNDLLPTLVNELDPDTDYWPSSPHTPVVDRRDFNNPDHGDAHLWSVWHGKEPFEWYRTCTHRFNSEFGFQSFPEPRTVATYTEPRDRNITSFVMEHHQRSGIGNSTIIHYMLDWFRLPTSFDMTLWLSQILQGMAIKYAVEHWRRGMPRGMGTLYWQLNDTWQVASWSSIDYFGNWKALHHMARDFFAPVLVSGVEDPEHGTVAIHVTNDRGTARTGELRWLVTDLAGRVLAERSGPVSVGPRRNHLAETIALGELLEEHGARNLLVWLELSCDEEPASTNLVTFARPKHLELPRPEIDFTIAELGENCFRVTLTGRQPALWCWLELSDSTAVYSDNFLHLRPDRPVTVDITPAEARTVADVKRELVVRSLVDTYA